MTNLMEALAEAKRSIDFPRHAALHAASEAEINRLRAENARLREAGLAVVEEWDTPVDYFEELASTLEGPMHALCAALNEGGGE